MMTTSSHRESAKIYQFPSGGRTSLRASGEPAEATAELASRRVAKTACGSGWYHEAAIEEAERELKS
jgi:hypothetical protein